MRLVHFGIVILAVTVSGRVGWSQGIGQGSGAGSFADLPPYAAPVGSLAGASGERLWQMAQERYRAGDKHGAAMLTRQAAMAGQAMAIYEMGYMYQYGDGVPRSDAEAREWYGRGVAKRLSNCVDAMGTTYEAARPEDFGTALTYYQRATAAGSGRGAYDVARMYEFGLGVPLDLVAATFWYDKAKALGEPDAKERARKLAALYLKFDSDFASDQERDLYTDEGPWLAPVGRVFHSYAERMQYLGAHHGVKKDPASREMLRRLDEQQIATIQRQQAEEYQRTHPAMTGSQADQMRHMNEMYTGMRLWQAANPGMRSPGVAR